VARMLLRPSNLLVLDEPTNHLDLDSKDVLLDALADYGGTLLFVSHDRYFVERLATKIVEVGHGQARPYPGTYAEFLWSQANGGATPGKAAEAKTADARPVAPKAESAPAPAAAPPASYEDRKRDAADRKKRERAYQVLATRVAELEARIAERETEIKTVEAAIAAPGFYDRPADATPTLSRHQALMWEVGDLLSQWEMLQAEAEEKKAALES